jgi:hypothetical protein
VRAVALVALFGTVLSVRPALWASPALGEVPRYTLSRNEVDILDDVARRSFRYFFENTDPNTGLVLDRATVEPGAEESANHKNVASIAATGFGLTSYCIAADHRWISRETGKSRVLTALRFLAHSAPQEHGWFYHFMDASTGQRVWHSEVSSIDTALLLAGVLTARSCFQDDPDVVNLATIIYNRIDFPWMLDGSGSYFSHGWTPELGFIRYRWDTYSELLILYALGIGSPTHPVSPSTWDSWNLPIAKVGKYHYVGGGPLFIHQYSQAWLDLRNRYAPEVTEAGAQSTRPISLATNARLNYWANSIAATRAQQEMFSNVLSRQFPGYSAKIWGVTASDSSKGYTAWGSTLQASDVDGTVVPAAAAGSLMFTPDICLPTLRTMLIKYGSKIYGRYGFADAFNPETGWVSKYYIGIDVGITLLSAENLRDESVWRWFMKNPEPQRALDLVGLKVRPSDQGSDKGNIDARAEHPEAAPGRTRVRSVQQLP